MIHKVSLSVYHLINEDDCCSVQPSHVYVELLLLYARVIFE